MDKVVRNGQVAVLYSPGFGAGWYTWNTSHPECLFHPEIVALVEAGAPVTSALCAELFGPDFYDGGAPPVIAWVPQGVRFIVREYDGSEHIEIITPKIGIEA